MSSKYTFFYLELALRVKKDSNIYAFENVSHIPTGKLIKIFQIDIKKDPYLLEGYFFKKKQYKKHRKYIKENIGQVNLDIFQYCLRQYVTSDFKEIRKLYKENLME
ncbi:MAG: hypothetical protein ABIP30_07780 [Ferruginibacter sp.]